MWIDKGYQCDKCRKKMDTENTGGGIFVKVGNEIVAELCADHAPEFKELIQGGLTTFVTARATDRESWDSVFIRVGNDVVAVITNPFMIEFKKLIQKELVTRPGPPPDEVA